MMKKAIWAVTCTALLAFGAAVVAQEGAAPSATDVTDKVQKFYQDIQDYQSNFTQVYTDVAAGDETKSGGKVFFKKPGKMRWDYYESKDGKTHVNKVLVSDGKEFNIYEAAYAQYYRQCLGDSQLPSAISFLMGTGDLAKEFTTKLLPSKDAGMLLLELTPKKSSGKYKKIVFRVDAASYAVTRTTVYDPYGNTNVITFKKADINKKLPDSGFNFPAPKGARILGGGKELKCE
jgi:outer membrane lipoprotein carrier protein